MNIRLVDIDLYSVVLFEGRFTVVALAVLQLVVGYEIPREGELDRHAVVLTGNRAVEAYDRSIAVRVRPGVSEVTSVLIVT